MTDIRKLLSEATPGPWSIGRDIIGKRETTGFVRWIVQLAWDDEQGQADARLIAMAPDLAAAVLVAEEAFERLAKLGNDGARAALAEIRKLTGGV